MIDWALVAKVAGGGFGVTILVLTVLSVVLWLVGRLARESETRGEKTE
jgi:Na+-transporting methylmalonyl-CoA/oxaloacetate decarboxylase gamma subunit